MGLLDFGHARSRALQNVAAATTSTAALTSNAKFMATAESIRLYRHASATAWRLRVTSRLGNQPAVEVEVVGHHGRG